MKELKSGIPYRDLEGKVYVSLDGDLYQIADGSGTKIEAQNAPKHLLTEDEYKQREEELENIQVGQVWETVRGRGTICQKSDIDGYLTAPYGWSWLPDFVRFTGEIQGMLNAKVGEKWRTRGGQIATIVEDDKGAIPYLVKHGDKNWHFANGQIAQTGDEYRDLDLVELVEDVKPEIPGEEVDVKTLRAGDIVAAESDGSWHEYMLLDNWCEGLRCFYVRPLGTKELDTIQVNGLRLVSRSTQPQLKVGQKWKRYDGAIVTIKALDPEIIDHAVGRKNSGRRPFVMDELTYATPAYASSEANPFNLVELVEDAPQQVEAPAADKPQGEIVPFESLRAGDVVYVKRYGEWFETELYANPSDEHELGCARPYHVHSHDEIILKQRYDGPSLKEGQKWKRRDGSIVTVKTRNSKAYPFSCGEESDGIYAIPSYYGRRAEHPMDLVELIEGAPVECGDFSDFKPFAIHALKVQKSFTGKNAPMPTPQVGEKWLIDRDKMHFAHIMGKGETESEYRILKAHEPHKGIQTYTGPFIAKSDGYIKWEDKWWEVTVLERSATSDHAKVETFVDQWTMDVAQMDLHPKPHGEGAQKVAGKSAWKKDAVECLVDVLGKQLEEGVMEVAMAEMQEAFKESRKQSAPQKDFKFKIPAPKNPKWDFSAFDDSKRETVSEPTTLHTASVTLHKEKPTLRIGQKWKTRDGREWVIYEKADEKDKERGYSFYCMEEGRRFGVSIAVTEEGFKYRNKEVSDYDLVELVEDAAMEQKDKPQHGDVWRTSSGHINFILKEDGDDVEALGYNGICTVPSSTYQVPRDTLLGRLPEGILALSKMTGSSFLQFNYLSGVFGGMTEAEKKASLDNNKTSSLHSKEASVPYEDKAEDEEMASKAPNHKQEDGVSASQFNEYLQREVERLNVKVEERDKIIAELHERFALRERDFASALIELKMGLEQEDNDKLTALAMKVDALHALTATGVDCMTDELANAIERIDRQASDVATLVEKSTKKETCPIPAPKEDETLDKGLKLTHRTLTALEIAWKIIKFAIAASIVGGGAVMCASMVIK